MIDKTKFSNEASSIRKKLGEDESSPIDIFNLALTIDNLTLIFYSLERTISGVCYKGDKSNLIIINSDMSIGRQRFSLAHEFFYLFCDHSKVSSVSLIQIGNGDETEKKADQFASYFLIPQFSLYEKIKDIKMRKGKMDLSIEDVIALEQYFGVSHKAMLYRLVDDKYIDWDQFKTMESGVIEIAAKLGYDTAIYYPSAENKKNMVLGHYVVSAERLLSEELISQGKYEELLLDAFRDDLVYGIEEERNLPLD